MANWDQGAAQKNKLLEKHSFAAKNKSPTDDRWALAIDG
jgi:hypothetical protein